MTLAGFITYAGALAVAAAFMAGAAIVIAVRR